jgi:hypothetical protein
MKTRIIHQIAKVAALFAIGLLSSNSLIAQFTPTTTVDQSPIVEERKGNTSVYSLDASVPVGDSYMWQVVGPLGTAITVPAAGVTGSGTVGDPFEVSAVGLTSITVKWAADDNTITSVSGNVSVQESVTSGTEICPSQIQSLDIDFWSAPTLTISDTDYELCSGDNTAGDITLNFTGAPGFDFKYTITGLDGVTSAETVITDIATATTTIGIPANLVNTSSTVDQTYVVTITEFNDDFDVAGTISDGSFTITVHPTIETGDISSDNTLTRRP